MRFIFNAGISKKKNRNIFFYQDTNTRRYLMLIEIELIIGNAEKIPN